MENLQKKSLENTNNLVDLSELKFFNQIVKAAKYDVTILLLGESGTGKTTCAKFIHRMSSRFENTFFTINCTTIPDNLIESELFGYEEGSFTGASKKGKKGLVELANNGTLFLDEIGELPFTVQGKLLELIENKTYTPVGGYQRKSTDIRIIAATNKNLKQMVQEKKFREDLYYRINVIEFKMPSLREIKFSVPDYINSFLYKLNKKYGTNKIFKKSVIDILTQYDWPGNIRELEHVIERLILLSDGDIISEQTLKQLSDDFETLTENRKFPTLKEALEETESQLVLAAYRKYKSSYKVAQILDISQTSAYKKIHKYIK
ncbi:MAG: sigma-54 interaction domain-containing protein [Sarcina sp.]